MRSWPLLLIAAALPISNSARAACGVGNSGATYEQVHVGQGNQIIWCADPTFWAQHSADVSPFFSYYDALLPVIGNDFGVNAPGPFYIAVDPPNGGASTPTPFGQGVNITGDAFYGVAYGIRGFYGYLLGTHEFVNQWTGILGNGGGWPNDWWADHRSPFPNAIDPILLAQMGQAAAAQAQYSRFIPGGDSADTEVVMFTQLFNNNGKWPFMQRTFALLRADGTSWGALRDPPNYTTQTAFVSGNPSAMLADYIVAYFSLAAGKDLSSTFTQQVGVGLQPPNWPSDQRYTPYAVDANQVNVIANAHCGLAAAGATTAASGGVAAKALSQFHQGNYPAVDTTLGNANVCGAVCPSECGCDTAQLRCVALWNATPTTGGGATGSSGTAGATTSSGGTQTGAAPIPTAIETQAGLHTTGGCSALDPQLGALLATLFVFSCFRRRTDATRLAVQPASVRRALAWLRHS